MTPETQKMLMDVLKVQPQSVAAPLSPFEQFELERSQLSNDPVVANLQRLGRAIKGFLVPETPLDIALAGIGAVKPVKAGLDVAKRLENARKMGFDIDNPVYHGTTHNIKQFDPQKANIEGHLGKSIYFTDNPIDASKNYAGFGPDLTARAEQLAERTLDNIDDLPKEVENKILSLINNQDPFGSLGYKKLSDVPENLNNIPLSAWVKEYARKELSGGANNIIPAYLKMKNPVDLTDSKKGFELNIEYDEAGDFVDETGSAVDLYYAIMRVANKYDFDGQQLFNDLYIDDFKSFADTDKAMRKSSELVDVMNDEGAFAANEVIKDIYREAGFDGVVLDASQQFTNMNIPKGTKHYQVFEAPQVRSIFAKFDPKKEGSGDILAGVSGASLLGVASQDND